MDDQQIEKALTRLKKFWEKNLSRDFKRHLFHVTRGQTRRLKKLAGIRRVGKRERWLSEIKTGRPK